jgi:hypothetical protein
MHIRAGPLVSFLTVSDRKNSFFIRVGFSFSVSTFALTLKTKLMTEQQSLLFREILDLNWEFTHESVWSKKWELSKTLSAKKQELRESMGHREYDTFIETGRKMFAPLEVEDEIEE